MIISIAELRDLTTKAIAGFGYNEEEIAAIREILLYAQLRGNNQGVVKLIGKGIPKESHRWRDRHRKGNTTLGAN